MAEAPEGAPAPKTDPAADAQTPAPAAPSSENSTPSTVEPASSGAGVEGQATPASAAEPVSTPSEEPKAAPAEVAPEPVKEPVKAEPEKAPEAKADAKPEEKKAETLLGKDGEEKKPEAKAEEKKVDAPKDEAKPDEPLPLPTYEPLTIPEDVKLDDAKLGDFIKEIGEFELTSKADHGEVQKLAQRMMDRHVSEVKEVAERISQANMDAWEKQRNDWKDQFEKDPELGGERQQQTLSAALQFIRAHGGSKEQQAELRQFFDTTGIGNYPGLIRIFSKANTAMAEGKPIPATQPPQAPKSRMARMYGGKS